MPNPLLPHSGKIEQPEPPVVPFEDQSFADQISTIVSHGVSFGIQYGEFQTMHGQASGSILRNQIQSNLDFINRWAVIASPPQLVADVDGAWQAYLDWLGGVPNPVNKNNSVWYGTEATFYGYAGWWNYVRDFSYYNHINMMN